MEKNVRLNAIGDLGMLPEKCYNELQNAIARWNMNPSFQPPIYVSQIFLDFLGRLPQI